MEPTPVAGSSPETVTLRSRSSSGSITTTSPSMFSRGHSTRSSTSSASMTSSPLPARDSFDLYGSGKRLEKVREEPQEPEDEWTRGDDEKGFYVDLHSQPALYTLSPTSSQQQAEYSLGEQDILLTPSPGQNQFKRQRSLEHRNSVSDRFSSRFGSLSRRWKTRSVIGPQLSIITHSASTVQRSSSATSSQIVSPALSAISMHESYLPTSPVHVMLNEAMQDSSPLPPAEADSMSKTPVEEKGPDRAQATTPLLPPLMSNVPKKHESLIQSPLQSPAIAATICGPDTVECSLPSPPLSHQPSVASMQKTSDIPPLYLNDDTADPWALRLGHANFFIHPEPYSPDALDIESYREFRANWEHARKQYAQHLARTNEHYGETSKVYKLTQEKWAFIDNAWKRRDDHFASVLSPALLRLSDSDSTNAGSLVSSSLLEKPLTRIVVPPMDKSGKFPEMGDADIVGPLSVAAPRAPELQRRDPTTPPRSPRKRTLFRYLSDVLGRHNP